MSKVSTWRIVQNSNILIQQYEQWGVVYNSFSGETHQMNDVSIRVLKFMTPEAFTIADLKQHITAEYEQQNISDLDDFLNQIINDFDRIGLVEPDY